MSRIATRSARSLAFNSLALVGGRILLSLGRLGVAVAVARLAGAQQFGEYVLLLGFVAIFEWLVDFGQTDIAVRRICAEPAETQAELATLAALKRTTSLALGAALPLVLAALQYSAAFLLGGLAASVAIVAYGFLQTDRALLKVGMRLDLDIASELAGLAVMLPATALAARWGGSPWALGAAYSLSRVVHALMLRGFANRVAGTEVKPGAAWQLARTAAPLGLAGLMVALYDGLVPIMLSKLMTLDDVARYGVASRFAVPVLTVVQAITGAFFPVLARRSGARGALAQAQAAALFVTLIVAGGLAVGLAGGAHFLVAIFGGKVVGATDVLRWMCWLVLARAFTMTMTPLIVIGGRQDLGLWLTLLSLVAQAIAIPLLVPHFGVLGVVIGYLAIELIIGVGPVSWLALAATATRIDWSVPARIIAAAAAAVLIGDRLPIAGAFLGGVASGLIFLGLVYASGVMAPARLQMVGMILRDRGATA